MTRPQPHAGPTLPSADDVRSIACLMINGIGDILCVSPTIQALKERYPQARMTVVVRPHLRALLEGSPFVDELLFYETDRPWKRPMFMWRLYRRRFDLWVDLHVPTFNTVSSNQRDFRRNAWLMRASQARYRRAYAVPELVSQLTHPVAVPAAGDLKNNNIVDTTLKLADAHSTDRYPKHMPVSAAAHTWAASEFPDRDGGRIGLFFGSRQAANLWPDARVLEFIDRLGHAMPTAELVLIGGEHEVALAATIAAAPTMRGAGRPRDFVCRASLGQTAALLARCSALVATDSGPMHIADAMQVPTVALFSSHNYAAIWRPVHRGSVLINHPVECGPCFRPTCHLGNKCMDMITPGEVLDALESLLWPTGDTRRSVKPPAGHAAGSARNADGVRPG